MKLVRDDQTALRTLGAFFTDDGVKVCDTLELPWKDNQHGVSCVPAGTYSVLWLWSPKHGRELYHITGVPNRDDVEIHIGNSVIDTEGCVLCGGSRGTLACRDGVTRDAVLGSHGAFDAFNAAANEPHPFQLEVVNPDPAT